jgi:hypothetical protein
MPKLNRIPDDGRMHITFDIATCIFYTGLDHFTKQQVYVAKGLRDRKMQRALLQFFKPENYFEVRKALIEAGRQDLIGGCEGLIPAQPPREAITARREWADEAVRGDHVHTIPNNGKGKRRGKGGYRPKRKTAHRRERR